MKKEILTLIFRERDGSIEYVHTLGIDKHEWVDLKHATRWINDRAALNYAERARMDFVNITHIYE